MVTACTRCPLRTRPIFIPMTDSQVAFMQQFKAGELHVQAGTTLMHEGSSSPQLYTALEGMGLRYKSLESGERQVISFIVPGDFIGLQAAVMDEMQHSVEATTDMKLCVFDRKAFWTMFRDHPRRAYDVTWIAAVEEHFLGETLAVLGHLSGIERIARAVLRLYQRAEGVGFLDNGRVPMPYKQQDLADALGLSLVHTNKTLKRLRDQGVVEWRDGYLSILDPAALHAIAAVEIDAEPIRRPLM